MACAQLMSPFCDTAQKFRTLLVIKVKRARPLVIVCAWICFSSAMVVQFCRRVIIGGFDIFDNRILAIAGSTSATATEATSQATSKLLSLTV